MTIELKKAIESELRRVYTALGFTDETVINRKINGQLKMMTVTQPKMIYTTDDHELFGKPLFVAIDDNNAPVSVKRYGEVYSKRQETWLVMFVTETYTWLLIETLDHLHPTTSAIDDILENGVWKTVSIEDVATMKNDWLILY